MLGVPAANIEPVSPQSSVEAGVAGLPCVFSSCRGFLHPASGTIGVVLCAPWGFEDLTMRTSWRRLAETVAAAGYPCLRFDYPGTGDSDGAAADIVSVSEWVAAINAAADFLRRTTGVRQFVFVGQTLGATLAVEAAKTRRDVAALHLIAPVVKGRAHVRELAATSKLVADRLGILLDPREALSVMGFAMSAPLVESLRGLDITKVDTLSVATVAIYDQLDRKAAAEAVEHFRRLGTQVVIERVDPYHLMISDATAVQALPVDVSRLVSVLGATTLASPRFETACLPSMADSLVAGDFREEPLMFGPDDRLFGILCTPRRASPDQPVVVLLNRGLNPHIGWRRVSVDQARGLAQAGIASLRIDVAGLGESHDEPGRPTNLIYSDRLVPDVRAAIDALEALGYTSITLAGVCSGAYTALQVAQADPRVANVIAVNTQRFVWNPKESVEDVLRFGLRSMKDYVGDIRSGSALRKLIRSRGRIAPAMAFLAKRSVRDALVRVPLRVRSLVFRDSLAGRVQRFFATFAARGTRVALVYSAHDPGLMELRSYYGPEGCDLRLSNVSVSLIPGADHNLTTTDTSMWMLQHMIAVVRENAPRDDAATALIQTYAPRRAVCPI